MLMSSGVYTKRFTRKGEKEQIVALGTPRGFRGATCLGVTDRKKPLCLTKLRRCRRAIADVELRCVESFPAAQLRVEAAIE